LTDCLDLLDPAAGLARPDLAEQALEGLVRARAYRPTVAMRCRVAAADVRAGAEADAARIDQLIFGEAFDVLERQGDLAWGRARRDGVVGWIDAAALAEGAGAPTHRVQIATAALHDRPGLNALSLNALVAVAELDGPWAQLADGGRMARDDLAPFDTFDPDPAAAAERLLGLAHELGARGAGATDCCGLVQQALYACGLAGPRYAPQQAQAGHEAALTEARRGDLVVWLNPHAGPWGGHAGVMIAPDRLLHASGRHGAVVIESLAETEERYAAEGYADAVFRRVVTGAA
jgi:cell wall-associated NlpC family hydrolase